jgi:two-component system cell cycle response regulator DivK
VTALTTEISSWRVLVVDDKPVNLKLITLILKAQNAEIMSIEDSWDAIQAIETYQPNLILLDLAMPGISGWDIHKQLRTRPELDDVPIVAITALAMTDNIQEAKEAGFDGYITKPYHVDSVVIELVECVAAFTERKRQN